MKQFFFIKNYSLSIYKYLVRCRAGRVRELPRSSCSKFKTIWCQFSSVQFACLIGLADVKFSSVRSMGAKCLCSVHSVPSSLSSVQFDIFFVTTQLQFKMVWHQFSSVQFACLIGSAVVQFSVHELFRPWLGDMKEVHFMVNIDNKSSTSLSLRLQASLKPKTKPLT